MAKTIYRSKIGSTLVLFLVLVIGGTSAIMAVQEMWWGQFPLLIVTVFIFHLFLNTFYTIKNDKLIIRCGFIYNQSIEINTIKQITTSNLAMSAPATSLDRLEILYNKFDTVLISPKDKEGLVKHLLEINPAIEIKV